MMKLLLKVDLCSLVLASLFSIILGGNFVKPVPPTNTRLYFRSYIAEQNVTTVAEIGVQKGWFSEILLQAAHTITKYYMVDIWREQKFYDDSANYNNTIQEEIMKEALQRTSPYRSKTEIIRNYSVEASTMLKNSITDPKTGKFEPILDFLYLDARHDYCGCREDIIHWWPLLKPGGLMSGHDFIWNYDREWNVCANGTRVPGGVRAAVMDWAAEQDLQLLVTQRDRYETWSIRKPVSRPNYNLYVKPIIQAPRAGNLGEVFQTIDPQFSYMVELNPGTGYFMHEFLWRWKNCKIYYAVDTRPANYSDTRQDLAVQRHFQRRLEYWNEKVAYLRESSEQASISIPNNLSFANEPNFSNSVSSIAPALDIVFIGGRNDHCAVAKDIKIWWPLIKPGGILAGHGYHWLDKIYSKCVDESGEIQSGGVRTAVLSWAMENDLQIVMLASSHDKTWWVRKPIARS